MKDEEIFLASEEGTNIINTAKHAIERELFDCMTKHSKDLLEQQHTLEEQLAAIKSKINQIENDPTKYYKENTALVNGYKYHGTLSSYEKFIVVKS